MSMQDIFMQMTKKSKTKTTADNSVIDLINVDHFDTSIPQIPGTSPSSNEICMSLLIS
jgi:hypothetical protein